MLMVSGCDVIAEHANAREACDPTRLRFRAPLPQRPSMSTKKPSTKAPVAGANKRGRADEEKVSPRAQHRAAAQRTAQLLSALLCSAHPPHRRVRCVQTAPTPAASNARSSGASAAKAKSTAAASSAAAAPSSAKAAAAAAAAPLAPPVLGARANAAWHATVGRTRKGRTALEQRDEDAENQAALEAVRTLDDDEDENADDDDEDAEAPEQSERKQADGDDDDEEAGLEAELDFGDDSDDDEGSEGEEEEEDEDAEEDESEEEEAPKAKAKATKQSAAAAAAVSKAAASKPAAAAAASSRKPAASSKRSTSAASTTDEDSPSSPSLRGSASSEAGPPRHPRGIRFDGEGMEDDTLDDTPFEGNLAEGSDSSADEGEDGRSVKHRNRIGNVPLEWYAGNDTTHKKPLRASNGARAQCEGRAACCGLRLCFVELVLCAAFCFSLSPSFFLLSPLPPFRLRSHRLRRDRQEDREESEGR